MAKLAYSLNGLAFLARGALALIVWKGHVKGDWEKVRCLRRSGDHIFHQTVVHSPRPLSCYRAAEREQRSGRGRSGPVDFFFLLPLFFFYSKLLRKTSHSS